MGPLQKSRGKRNRGKSKRMKPRPLFFFLSLLSLSHSLFSPPVLFFYFDFETFFILSPIFFFGIVQSSFLFTLITMNYYFCFVFRSKNRNHKVPTSQNPFLTHDAAYEKRLVFAIQLITFPIPRCSTHDRPPTLSVKYK